MTDRDEVAELADRLLAKQRRGEELGVEFEIEFGALTDEERDDFMALMDERAAHGEEMLEAIRSRWRRFPSQPAPVVCPLQPGLALDDRDADVTPSKLPGCRNRRRGRRQDMTRSRRPLAA
jgi:hypothetical protein